MKLPNKVALVTGAGSGIGRAIATLFSSEGASIGVADRNEETLRETVAIIKHKKREVIGIMCDVSTAKDAREAVRKIVRKFGKLDILVNCAGIDTIGSATSLSEEDWDRLIDVNLKGPFLLSKFAIPEIMKSDSGSIINVASTAGLVGMRNYVGYCASKGGVVSMTRAMALDLAPHKIRVNCLCPGDTKTAMFDAWLKKFKVEEWPEKEREFASVYPLKRLAEPLEMAKAALYLASEDASFATGSILVLDAGYTAQ